MQQTGDSSCQQVDLPSYWSIGPIGFRVASRTGIADQRPALYAPSPHPAQRTHPHPHTENNTHTYTLTHTQTQTVAIVLGAGQVCACSFSAGPAVQAARSHGPEPCLRSLAPESVLFLLCSEVVQIRVLVAQVCPFVVDMQAQ